MTTTPTAAAPVRPSRRRARADLFGERSIISTKDRNSRTTRMVLAAITVVVVGGLALISLGPLTWLFKAATSTTSETLADPFALWPSGLHWDNFAEAFSRVRFGTYLLNTLWICLGVWFFTMVVATTLGYFLAILRPAYAKVVSALILATLFIPGVVSLIALYLTVMNVPILGVNLLNTFWAVWLPSSANAFFVVLVRQAFASLPMELFEAARVDGAGKLRVFWSLVLPLSKPTLGVVSLLALVNAYKDFLWPLLVLPNGDMQPLSVALPRLEQHTELSVYMAALFLTIVIPLALFLVFHKQFLSAAGSQGAVKG